MKNTKQLLVIASIAAGISVSNKSVHAQQPTTNNIAKQPAYDYNICSNKVVKPGDKGSIVKDIQSALNLYCGAGLAEDGVYGQYTKEAVLEIQKKFCLKADGIFGPQTAKALLKYSSNYSMDDSDGFSPVSTDIQNKLIYLGYKIQITGNLKSSDTVAAIKDFQKKNNLPITGKIDTKIIDKINESIKYISDETKNFKSNTDYYVMVNTSGHICKVYQKVNNSWEQIRCFDVFSGEVNKGIYSLGLQGNHLNFNGIPMEDFTQIDGLKVFYSSADDSGYGLRIANENAKFLGTLPKKTSIKVF